MIDALIFLCGLFLGGLIQWAWHEYIQPRCCPPYAPCGNLLDDIRSPFNACQHKGRCIAWVETLERECLEQSHELDQLKGKRACS